MNERKKDNLLERACAYLGFHVEERSNGHKIFDRENRDYKRFLTDDLVDGLDGLLEVEDLLKTKVFEHYHFSWCDFYTSHQIVENSFYGMSKEQLAIELDLLGA